MVWYIVRNGQIEYVTECEEEMIEIIESDMTGELECYTLGMDGNLR